MLSLYSTLHRPVDLQEWPSDLPCLLCQWRDAASTLRVSLSSGVSLHIHPWAPSHTMQSVANPRDPEVPRSITTQGTTMDMRVHKPFCEFSKTSHPSVGYKEGFTNKLLQLACENRAVDGPSHFPPLTSYQTVQAHYLLRVLAYAFFIFFWPEMFCF